MGCHFLPITRKVVFEVSLWSYSVTSGRYTLKASGNAWCVLTDMEHCVLHVAEELWEVSLMRGAGTD